MSVRAFAIIDSTGLCTNVCSWDGATPWSPPSGCTAIDISTVVPQPGIGWTYINNVWTLPAAPPTIVPSSVTRFQAMAELSNMGLLAQVTALIPNQSTLVQLAWANAQSFDRDSPTIAALAESLGLTSAQIDQMFIAAATIKA